MVREKKMCMPTIREQFQRMGKQWAQSSITTIIYITSLTEFLKKFLLEIASQIQRNLHLTAIKIKNKIAKPPGSTARCNSLNSLKNKDKSVRIKEPNRLEQL